MPGGAFANGKSAPGGAPMSMSVDIPNERFFGAPGRPTGPVRCARCGGTAVPDGAGWLRCPGCGSRWSPPQPRPTAPVSVSPERFFSAPRPPERPHFLFRTANDPVRFAAVLLGAGAFAVFVQQAPLLYQLVLGAPLFEEALKFGLALLLVAPAGLPVRHPAGLAGRIGLAFLFSAIAGTVAWGAMETFSDAATRHALLGAGLGAAGGFALVLPHLLLTGAVPRWALLPFRLLSAAMVGAGFGILEHALTYDAEPRSFAAWRAAFHGLSTVVSMAAYQALEPAPEVRARWFATGLSTVVHYLNNAGSLLIFVGVVATGGGPDDVPEAWSYALTASLVAFGVAALAVPRVVRCAGTRLAARLPGASPGGPGAPAGR